MSDVTQINKELTDNSTVINNEVLFSQETVVNTEIVSCSDIRPGTVIFGKYTIVEKMNTAAGEASLYICESEGKRYAAKFYHRKAAVKPEVISALRELDSKYISKLYEYGVWNGRPVEVMQYYENGSLEDRRYTFGELKNMIIPCVNEGLKVLHDAGIIHKDLKPSNVMLNDDRDSVAIIDFGISSVEENGNTVILTKTGMTPEYSAPEALRGIFLEESDYYSFGIILYKLYSGITPYQNLGSEQISQYLTVQRIPFPDDMPAELKDLIAGLTYYDITNRKNLGNPNRCWTYREVQQWCNGISLPALGESTGVKPSIYTFLGQKYEKLSELVQAMAVNWNDGKSQLLRGLLSGFFRNFNPEIAGFCLDAEKEAAEGANDDIIFFRLLYKLDADLISFCWKGKAFGNIMALGQELLDSLTAGRDCSYYADVLKNRVLSEYIRIVSADNEELQSIVAVLEKSYRINENDERQKSVSLYTMGYVLSDQKTLRLDNQEFNSINELIVHMTRLLKESYNSYEECCSTLIGADNQLNVQFESWLIALGKRKELADWKSKFVN